MTSNSPLLEARGLTRRHPDGRRWLLDGVSLRIARGDRLMVTGPSGSGKTLLLRALALLDPLDRGEVHWRGRPVRRAGVPDFRRQAIYIHQRPALPGESVEAAIRLPLALGVHRGRQFDRKRILRWLDELGRDPSFLAKVPGDLSGGESQIVALVRALQLDPAVLMLDEPTAALDRKTTGAAEELLDRWVAESPDARALVWVTHDAGCHWLPASQCSPAHGDSHGDRHRPSQASSALAGKQPVAPDASESGTGWQAASGTRQAASGIRRVVRMEQGRLTEEEPHAG